VSTWVQALPSSQAAPSLIDAQSPTAAKSVTLTVNSTCDGLPAASLAVHVTVWLPIAKRLPDGGVQVTARLPLT
jgi:hypothetical protein